MNKFDWARKKGAEAFRSHKKYRAGNPFEENTPRHQEWERGFNEAYMENLNKVIERENKKRA